MASKLWLKTVHFIQSESESVIFVISDSEKSPNNDHIKVLK